MHSILRTFTLTPDGRTAQLVQQALDRYASMIEPWAESVAAYMLADIDRRNEVQWRQHSKNIARGLRTELYTAPTGLVTQQLLQEQVGLIKSLPRQAAQEVHALVLNNMPTGKRFTELVGPIMQLGARTEARARRIARTETSRAAATFTEARAMAVGSDGYVWRTVGDADVRASHQEMEGRYVRWGQPPTLDNMKGHAGCLPNCRCWADVVLPGEQL